MHKLVRGNLACFSNSHMEIIQQLLSESRHGDMQEVISSARLSHNYSDTLYSISFRANRTILIKALSFWGPFRQEKQDYKVKVIFSECRRKLPSEYTTDEVVMERFEVFAEAENSKICLVQCPRAVRIEKGRWTRIRFQLDGPETCVCSSVSSSYYLKDCDMEFEFLDSSHQIPEIHFQILE